jgi:hypothetical protein
MILDLLKEMELERKSVELHTYIENG